MYSAQFRGRSSSNGISVGMFGKPVRCLSMAVTGRVELPAVAQKAVLHMQGKQVDFRFLPMIPAQ